MCKIINGVFDFLFWGTNTKNWLIWKDPDAGKDWKQEEKGMTGWDGGMTSPTQWTWVWAGSRSWWWTGKSMGSQRVGHDWVTELNWGRLTEDLSQGWILSDSSKVGAPNLQHLIPDDLRWSWYNNNRNKGDNKYKALESPQNHPCRPVYGKIIFHDTNLWHQKDWRAQL